MSRVSPIITFFVGFSTIVPLVLADPSDLLNQAIEENNAAPNQAPAKEKGEIRGLIDHADQLLQQKKFNQAIELYQKAYRLSPGDQNNYVRLLVAKRAAGRMTDQDRQALILIEEQQTANIDQVFRTVRLNLIQARQSLRQGDIELSKSTIKSALANLDRLPKDVDAAPYRRELYSLLNVLYRKAGKQSTSGHRDTRADDDGSTLMVITREVEKEDANHEAIDEATADRPEAHAAQAVTENVETGEIIDIPGLLGEDSSRYVFDRELSRAVRRNRARTMLDNNEAALPPVTDMTFPKDWPERTARRSRYRDGVIYRGKPYTGKDGKTRYTAVYDIGDLLHPVPNFYATYPGSAREQRFQNLDRFYLQQRSQIFNGYAEDLAEGLPLLHFFGGIDNNAISTRTDPRENERLMQILDRFIHDNN